MAFLFIAFTILFTVTGQILLKSATNELGPMPTKAASLWPYLLAAYSNLRVIGGLFLAFLASISWLGAVSKIEVSTAYPFMGLAIVLVLLLSPIFLSEEVPFNRWIGVVIVCIGLFIASR